MTREEARDTLNKVKTMLKLYPKRKKQKETVNQLNEAIDMAIEALQAEYEDYEHATLVDIKEPLKVEVLRCKDCRYWEYVQGDGDCIRHTSDTLGYAIQTNAEDFCSYGERREPDKCE